MSEIEEEISAVGLSKFWRITLTISAMFLILVGSTYVPYVLAEILKVNYVLSIIIGVILFFAGIGLILFLVRKKVIT